MVLVEEKRDFEMNKCLPIPTLPTHLHALFPRVAHLCTSAEHHLDLVSRYCTVHGIGRQALYWRYSTALPVKGLPY
jgi:hypothetical protein